MLVIPALLLCVLAVVYWQGGRYVSTDNAYVKASKVPVSPRVSGQVIEASVEENRSVRAGDLLFRLDPVPFRIAADHAAARLAQVRTDLLAAQAGYRAKQAEIALADTRSAFARRDQQRQSNLAADHVISAAQLDRSTQGVDVAAQEILLRQRELQQLAATLGGDAATPVEQLPAYRAALADLERAKLELGWTEVRAALPGVVGKPPKPGQFVAAGATVMPLVVIGAPWIEANFPENDLTHVHPGQAVDIHVDTYPDQTWRGRVESLSPATGSEFSLIPPQNASGNWVKVVQRIPVRIRLDDINGKPPLIAGMSAEVRIDTGYRRRLPFFGD